MRQAKITTAGTGCAAALEARLFLAAEAGTQEQSPVIADHTEEEKK